MHYSILIFLLLGVLLIQSNGIEGHNLHKREILSISSSPMHVVSSVPVKTYTIKRNGQLLYVTTDELNLTQDQVLQKVQQFELSQKQFSEQMQQSFAAMSQSFQQMANNFGQMQMF